LPSTANSPKWYIFLRFSDQNFVTIFFSILVTRPIHHSYYSYTSKESDLGISDVILTAFYIWKANILMELALKLKFTDESWSRVFLEKLIVTQLVKKLPAFNGTRRFITLFATASHWFLPWARCIQSTTSHPVSVRSILILSCYLRLGFPIGLSPSSYLTKILYAFLISSMRATCPAHILLDLITLIIFAESYKL